jgi:hypothetical protein
MSGEEKESEFMGTGLKMFTIADDRELMPILCKPKIIPIKSALVRQIEERENELLIKEKRKEPS